MPQRIGLFASLAAAAIVVAAIAVAGAGRLFACPFCVPVKATFGQEIASADAVVFAKLVNAAAIPTNADGAEIPKSKFEIVEVVKGEKHLGSTKTIELLYFREAKVGDRFLMMAVDPPKLAWATPTLLNETSERYVRKVITLPKEGAQRLAFFQDYLEDKDEMLASDAYDEFARAPYDQVQALKPHMHHEQLTSWIKNPEVNASRRRLYLTMLGVCGDRSDADLLEGMLRAEDRKLKSGLDALIACYMTLRGAEGMPLVEELFLKNAKCEYADTYSAIMALRFHGQETNIIPRPRILQAMHLMLDRPELADLVIVDLARWEDWSVMDRLVMLFKNADEKSAWVRVPVVRYLMACPKPEAKKHLEELEKIDPASARRAKTFFPFDAGNDKPATSAVEPANPATVAAAATHLPAPAFPAAIPGAIQPVAMPHATAAQLAAALPVTVQAAIPAPAVLESSQRLGSGKNHFTAMAVLISVAVVLAGGIVLVRRDGLASPRR